MVDILLPKLYAQLSGQPLPYRSSTVRAGGSYEQDPNKWETTGYFLATKSQVEILKQNKYLFLQDQFIKPYINDTYKDDGSTFLVYYFYPSPQHLSADVKQMLEADEEGKNLLSQLKATYSNTTEDQDLLNTHTQLLVRILLLNLFSKYYAQPATHESIVQFENDLISIHPCTDFNGRTIRMFGLLAELDTGIDVDIPFVSDFDIVTDTKLYTAHLEQCSAGMTKLKNSMMGEIISAIIQQRSPNHYDLPQWKPMLESCMKTFSGNNSMKQFPGTFTDSENLLIEKRKFVELFDHWYNSQWSGRM
jgi:hypothetical protein